MKTHMSTLSRFGTSLLLVALAMPARSALLDHGPQDPTLLFPRWYRDLNGVALAECLSQTPSPNAAAALKPMCFAPNPDPFGFPGNVGPEVFYNLLSVRFQKGNPIGAGLPFVFSYLAGLEGSYVPLATPTHGNETVFARVRITMSTQTPGRYKVTHPFGVDFFTVAPNQVGGRSVFFTADVPAGVAMDFDSALGGRIGPWLQWDVVEAGMSLQVTTASGVVEQFIGDPNIAHTYTGSPFNTNFVRVDGPPGSNLDGSGNDFIQSALGTIVGQKWLQPIPTALAINRATYSRDATRNVMGIDVFASSAPGQQMIVSDDSAPSAEMRGDGAGNYFAHVELPANVPAPASVTVTNATSVPPSSVTHELRDVVTISSATFDTLTGVLKVVATSSDQSSPPPGLAVEGPLGGAMVSGTYQRVLGAGALPPSRLTVLSAAGGSDSEDVSILAGLPDNKPGAPVAVPDAVSTAENTGIATDVTANDATIAPATLAQVVVVSAPTNGTAVVAGPRSGVVSYTPTRGFFGTDSFQYVLVDSAGAVSNVATVRVTVNFVPVAPMANGDDFALLVNVSGHPSSRTYDVIANDVPANGTTINPASIAIVTPPSHGSAVRNANGTVTYTPLGSYAGLDSYTYTVSNSAGVPSNVATVNITVEGLPEIVSFVKVLYTSAKAKWSIVGSTTWSGAALLQTTVTCWVGKVAHAGALLGVAPVDIAGKFTIAPPTLNAPAPDVTRMVTCQTSNGGVASAIVTFN